MGIGRQMVAKELERNTTDRENKGTKMMSLEKAKGDWISRGGG